MKKFSIKIALYNLTCTIIISDNIDKVITRYCKKYKWISPLEEGDKAHGLAAGTTDLKNYFLFISTKSITPGVLAHEISHIVDDILRDRCMELSGEPRSYLTEHITEKVFDYILKNKLLIHKYITNDKVKEDEKPTGLLRQDTEDPKRD